MGLVGVVIRRRAGPLGAVADVAEAASVAGGEHQRDALIERDRDNIPAHGVAGIFIRASTSG